MLITVRYVQIKFDLGRLWFPQHFRFVSFSKVKENHKLGRLAQTEIESTGIYNLR